MAQNTQLATKQQSGPAAQTAVVIQIDQRGQVTVAQISPDDLPALQLDRAKHLDDALSRARDILTGAEQQAEVGLKKGFESVRAAEDEQPAARSRMPSGRL